MSKDVTILRIDCHARLLPKMTVDDSLRDMEEDQDKPQSIQIPDSIIKIFNKSWCAFKFKYN
jgi:hypothetical protein